MKCLTRFIVGGICAVVSVLQTQAVDCVPAPSGLVGWWRAENNANDEVSSNNGTMVNMGFTAGIVGQAFAFDPDSFPYGTYCGIDIPDQPAYALTNALTIEGWIRPRGNIGYNIFWRGDSRPGVDPYFLGMNGDHVRLYVEDESGTAAFVDAPLAVNQWWHVAATFDDGVMTLYTNGVLAAQTTTPIRPFAELNPALNPGIGIGNVNDGFNNFPFTGDVDEISLYNRALSPAEVQAIYNAGSAGKCIGPVNQPPVADAGATARLVISGNGADAAVTLDGSRSSDPDGDSLEYEWFEDGSSNPIATAAVAVVTLPVGENAITLQVSDGLASNEQTIPVDVITVGEALDRLRAVVDGDVVRPQPLDAILRAARASNGRGNTMALINQLNAFQNQVRAKTTRWDAALAEQLINQSQDIIDALMAAGF